MWNTNWDLIDMLQLQALLSSNIIPTIEIDRNNMKKKLRLYYHSRLVHVASQDC